MKLRGLRWQSIDLTHRCNLNCDWCGRRTRESDYEMTMEQIDNMLEYIDAGATSIRVSGGEPLVHPQFDEMLDKLLDKFLIVHVATNGTLLDDVGSNPRINFLVSHYGNGERDARFKDSTPSRFFDPRYDPDLDDDDAMDAYQRCPYMQIKVIGDKVYDCCHAETVERIYGGEFHARVGPNWQRDLESIERWQACKHCFVARPKTYEPTR